MNEALVVDSVIRVPVASIPPKVVERLWAKLQFPNPQYLRAMRFGRGPTDLPKTIELVEPGPDDTWLIPRGAVRVVREAFASAGQETRFDDRRLLLSPVEFTMGVEPRDYQLAAARALVQHHQGIVTGPPGVGKSVIGSLAIRLAGQPTLVLTRSRDLVEQWCGVLDRVLGCTPGVVAEGRFAPDVVTVATSQTLAAMDDVALVCFGERFGCVIVDECHSAATPTDRRILNSMPARYRFGLTATPDREDGLGPLLELTIGSVVYRIGHQELVQAGHLVLPEIRPVFTNCWADAENHTELVTALVKDDTRNHRIVDLVLGEARAGHTVLLLSGRVEHCDRIAAMIRDAGVSAEALTSQIHRTRRTEILDRFRAGTLPIVCATSLADEGLDVPRLDRLVLATPARAEGRTVQRLGRLMRPHPDKGVPVLLDLVDSAPLARRQFAARRAAYRKVLGDAPATKVAPPGGFVRDSRTGVVASRALG